MPPEILIFNGYIRVYLKRVPELGWGPIIYGNNRSLDGHTPKRSSSLCSNGILKKQDSWHEQNTSPKSTLPETND